MARKLYCAKNLRRLLEAPIPFGKLGYEYSQYGWWVGGKVPAIDIIRGRIPDTAFADADVVAARYTYIPANEQGRWPLFTESSAIKLYVKKRDAVV